MAEWIRGLADDLIKNPALLIFAACHFLGIGIWASARNRFVQVVAASLLILASGAWVSHSGFRSDFLGVNRATVIGVCSLFALLGSWLLLAGRNAVDWLCGFGMVTLVVALITGLKGSKLMMAMILFSHGLCLALISWQLVKHVDESETASPKGASTRWVSGLGSFLMLVLLGSAVQPSPALQGTGPKLQEARRRDLVVRPAVPIVLAGLALFSTCVARRIQTEIVTP